MLTNMLLENPQYKNSDDLKSFLSEKIDRIKFMTSDEKDNVGVEAIKVFEKIFLNYREFLDDKISFICEVMFYENREVAKIAASILLNVLSEEFTEEQRDVEENRIAVVKSIVAVYMESPKNDKFGCMFAEAMTNASHLLQNWEMMRKMLLDENSLSDEEKPAFVQLFFNAIKAATGETSVV